MEPPVFTKEQEELLQGIIGKIPTISDPDRLQEHVLLALELTLRRNDDHSMRETLIKCVRDRIAAVKARPGDASQALRRAADECLEVLQAARMQRLPRDVAIAQAVAAERPQEEIVPVADVPPSATKWGVIASGAFVVLVALSAIVALATHELWRNSPLVQPPKVLTASQVAGEIVEAVQALHESRPFSSSQVNMHLLRGGDDRAVVVVEGVPRRICSSVGAILARKGTLTINGTSAAFQYRSAIVVACRQRPGDADITWSPKPSDKTSSFGPTGVKHS